MNVSTWVPANLGELAEAIHKDGQPRSETVRTLLSWFDSQRRGSWITGRVRAALDEVALKTDPDFSEVYLDSEVRFIPAADRPAHPEVSNDKISGGCVPDPVPRIGALKAANTPPVSVSREAQLQEAITKMMMNNFSQLPVLRGSQQVQGVISWKSIGEARAAGRSGSTVSQFMDERIDVIPHDTPLLEAVELVSRREVVLVRKKGDISGLVTTYDISLQFRSIAEPFLLLREIENHLRRIIDGRFTRERLTKSLDPADAEKEIQLVSDLTLGEIIGVLSNSENWSSLGYDLDRSIVAKRLDEVRKVRNEVMHFDPDPLDESALDTLRDVGRFLQGLQDK